MALVVGVALVLCAGSAAANSPDVGTPIAGSAMERSHPSPAVSRRRAARLETLWIFDADFSTTTGDNAWTSTDRSGTLGMDNYWHHDTIRMSRFGPSR